MRAQAPTAEARRLVFKVAQCFFPIFPLGDFLAGPARAYHQAVGAGSAGRIGRDAEGGREVSR